MPPFRGWLENNCTTAKQDAVNAKQKAFWKQIATQFRDFDEHLLFASANEPAVEDATQMNVLLLMLKKKGSHESDPFLIIFISFNSFHMHAQNFQGKVAIVTGAGIGIGFEIARQLAREGSIVLLNDIDPAVAERAADKIKSEQGHCIPCGGDAGDIAFIRDMVSQAVKQYGKLDIVIANAGITLFGDFFSYTEDAFKKVMQVNLGGSFFLAQAAANQMKLQESGGAILFMSSVTGHQAHKNLAAYGMTKAALEMLAKNLVIELSPYRINVNAIAPGATITERTLSDSSYEATWSKITPMGRPATTHEIAAAALFLVSNAAKHITGQSLIVDGGWTSVSPPPD